MRFPLAYFLAHLALMLAYIPVFGLFLPVRIAEVSDSPLIHQSVILLIGGITASMAGVLAGRLSDWIYRQVTSRRPMLWAGLLVIGASYVLFALAADLFGLIAAVVILQVGINLVLGGLNAMFAVHVPAGQKAKLASMVNLCLPIANMGLVVLGGGMARDMAMRLALLGMLTLALSAPILLWRQADQTTPPLPNGDRPHPIYALAPQTRTWLNVFSARFFVQLSAALLLAFVHPYLAASMSSANDAARLLVIMVVMAAVVSLPIAIIAARLATSRWNPLTILQGAAFVLALAMAGLALTPSNGAIVLCYAMFMAALVTYLAIDTAVIAQWLAHSPEVASHLGVMNLANTLPGLIIPGFLLFSGGSVTKGLNGAFTITALGAMVSVALLAHAKGQLKPIGAHAD